MAAQPTNARRRAARRAMRIAVTLAGGRRLTARCWAGAGVPLVLLHGLLDSCEGWAQLCRSTPRPCIAIDLPGFGGSDLPSRPRISAYATDVIAVLKHLVVGECRLVGHSLGGVVAAAVAERAPARVTSLILLAPAGFGRIPLAEAVSIPRVRNVAQRVLPVGLRSRAALNLAHRTIVSNGAAPEPGVLDRVVTRSGELAPGAREGTRAVVAAGLSSHGFHRRRIAYDGPVTVLWGDRDRLVPRATRRASARRSRRRPACCGRAWGHHPERERPSELIVLLDAEEPPKPVAALVAEGG